MKRFLLFGSDECHYATGGANDFVDDFDTLNEAVIEGNVRYQSPIRSPIYLDWFHVFDSAKREIVFKSQAKPYGDY